MGHEPLSTQMSHRNGSDEHRCRLAVGLMAGHSHIWREPKKGLTLISLRSRAIDYIGAVLERKLDYSGVLAL